MSSSLDFSFCHPAIHAVGASTGRGSSAIKAHEAKAVSSLALRGQCAALLLAGCAHACTRPPCGESEPTPAARVLSLAEPVPKEVTVVLVKPDAVKEGKVEEIIQKVGQCM